MKVRFVRTTALMLCALITSISMGSVKAATAQTTRPRPKIQTNTAASYQYAYQHGYRAGYEDGFVKGKSDFNENRSRDYQNSDAYTRADRGYRDNLGGSMPEYQEAYRIGFEMAYNDSYYGRPYSISMPSNLGRAVISAVNGQGGSNNSSISNSSAGSTRNQYPSNSSSIGTARSRDDDRYNDRNNDRNNDRSEDNRRANDTVGRGSSRGSVIIPADVQMKVRLTSQLDTKTSREGDTFTALVLDPSEYADAEVTGHIAKLSRSGKASGKTEMALTFDSIKMRDGRSSRLNAQVERVYESESVKTVDEEGNVESSSRTKDTATRGLGGAALGAIIGGIAGGGKGAAIGAAVGGGLGVGSVYVQGGKDLRLEPGTEILIRTAGPSRN